MSILDSKLPVLKRVFSTAPVESETLFVGREVQLAACVGLLGQRGAHGLIYGPRGIGKTSLANIVRARLRRDSAKVNCVTDETGYTLWRKVFDGIVIESTLIYDDSTV